MAKISYAEARKLLKTACQEYIIHNESQLNHVKAKAPYSPDFMFFFDALDKYNISIGFEDWAICQYYQMLEKILSISYNTRYEYVNTQSYLNNIWSIEHGCEPNILKNLKYLQGMRGNKKVNHQNPHIVLHNLQALIELLEHCMNKKNIDTSYRHFTFDEFKQQQGFHEEEYSLTGNEPTSIQIYLSLRKLQALAQVTAKLTPAEVGYINDVYTILTKSFPTYMCYLKGVAASELLIILENKSLEDQQALRNVESLLRDEKMLMILKYNRQSTLERDLKLLSVISILIGVGIFTTLGLVCKRLYDSGGTSINFFKALSENLYEDLTTINAKANEVNPYISCLINW